jgi:hypothetical protein
MHVADLNCSVTVLRVLSSEMAWFTKKKKQARLWEKNRCVTNQAVTSKVTKLLMLPSTSLSQILDNGSKQNGGRYDLSTVMDKVKKKCATSSKQEVLKLLALLPKKLDRLHSRLV